MLKFGLTLILRILLLLLMLLCILTFGILLPVIAEEMALMWPEIAYIKGPMLIMTRTLVFLFMCAIGIIIYMTFDYDRNGAYTPRFLMLLRALALLGFLGSAGVTGVFFYLSRFGGPGPGPGLLMIGGTICILIVSVVLLLIHRIITHALEYKDVFDTTV